MKGYRREKNTQAVLATDFTALQQHRKSIEEKNQMKNKVNTLETEIQELKNIVNLLLKDKQSA